MARSLIHPSSNIALMYISSYWQSVSALPSASLASQKPVEVLFHNDTSCHNSSSVSQAAVAKDPEFLPTTTFGVFSVLLAFGSLIVGVIGIMHHRRRRRSLSRINTISQQSANAIPPEVVTAPAPVPMPTLPLLQASQAPPQAIGASTAICKPPQGELQQSSVQISLKRDSSDTLVATAAPSPKSKRSPGPPRPTLSHLRLRSSLLNTTEGLNIRACLRTSTM